mmetsp:Transcript_46855/g.124682  ORF Transcript_46855/g.124682 Transcript_46855/m.124682 type:complete len:596 (+) Transcript_46855:132-1919(+)
MSSTNSASVLLLTVVLVNALGYGCFGCSFQYASINFEWLSASSVKFTIQSQWRRNFTGSPACLVPSASLAQQWGLWSALASAANGEVVDIVGIDSSQSSATTIVFNAGDGTTYPIRLQITEISLTENFVHGVSVIYHTYSSPASLPRNFPAMLSGCCWQATGDLASNSSVNGGGEFRSTVRINPQYLNSSVIVRSLPRQIVGPFLMKLRLPSSSASGVSARYYRLGQGYDERGGALLPAAAGFNGSDYLEGLLTVDGKQLVAAREYPMVVEVACNLPNPSFVPVAFTVIAYSDLLWRQKPSFVSAPVLTDASGVQSGLPVIQAFVGFEVVVALAASTTRGGARVSKIRSPSPPDGSYLANAVEQGLPGSHTRRVDWRWTPAPGQSGRHYVCLEAVDSGAFPPLSSGQHCLALDVRAVAPTPAFLSPIPAAVFSTPLAAPLAFQLVGEAANPYDELTIAASTPLAPGQLLTGGTNRTTSLRAGDSSVARVVATWSWRPGLTLGGYRASLCFTLRGRGGPADERCVVVAVERCRYRVAAGETFESVAKVPAAPLPCPWSRRLYGAHLACPPDMRAPLPSFPPPPTLAEAHGCDGMDA